MARDLKRSSTRGGMLAGAALAALLALPAVASAQVTSSFSDGVLTVTSNAGDAIAITCVGGQVKIGTGDPGGVPTDCTAVTAIDVTGGPGDNAITLTGVTALLFPGITSVSVDGGAGDDTIAGSEFVDDMSGGAGDDRISGDDNPQNTQDRFLGEAGDDTLVWNPGDDSDLMDGGDGTDTIEVNGGGGNENFTAKPSATAGRVQFDRDAASAGGAFDLDIGTSERLDMNANGGNDTFASDGAIAALGFALDVDGGAGDDTLDGSDGADLIDGGDGNDSIAGDDNQPGTQDVSRGGAGDDTMTWNPGDDDDVNEGGDGDDTSVVNGAPGDERFTVKPSATAGRVRLDRTDPAPFNVDIGTTENLLVNGGDGDDRIRGSKQLAGLIASTFNGDDGSDRLRGTDGADVLTGGNGHDLIKSIDKAEDAVRCGAGFDLALVDKRDTVQGCELAIGGALRVKLVGKPELAGNAVALQLRCVGTSRCKVKARLRHGGHKVGGGRIKLDRGDTKTIRVKLNRRGRRLMANHSGEAVRTKLRLVSRDDKGNGWRTTMRIKLHP